MLATCHSQKESAEEDEYLNLILGHSLDKLTANEILCFWHCRRFPIHRENKGIEFWFASRPWPHFFPKKQTNCQNKSELCIKKIILFGDSPTQKRKDDFDSVGFQHEQLFLYDKVHFENI
jgi:hypothetical protein